MTRHHRGWHFIAWLILVPVVAVLALAAQDLAGRRAVLEPVPAAVDGSAVE